MESMRNAAIKSELFEYIREEYQEDRTQEMHLSDTYRCLTLSYFEKVDPLPLTETELLYFSMGFAMESVILRSKMEPAPDSYEVMGLRASPDKVLKTVSGEVDLKTTRAWPDEDGVPKKGWSDRWMKQFMGYAYRLMEDGKDYVDYNVAILYMSKVPPSLEVHTLRFDRHEVNFNMIERVDNADKIREALAKHKDEDTDGALLVVQPFTMCDCPSEKEDGTCWECKGCRYLDRCKAWQESVSQAVV